MFSPKTRLFSGSVQSVDVIPAGAVNAGDPVVINGVVYFYNTDLAAGQLGAASFDGGVWAGNKTSGAWTIGDRIYWDSAGNPNVGTAGTGAYNNIGTGTFAGFCVPSPNTTAGALTADQWGYFVKSPVSVAGTPAAQTAIADPGASGAIPVTVSGNVLIVTAGAETRTIAAPTVVGQFLILDFKTKVGNCVITVASTINATGNNTISLTAAGQSIELVGVVNGTTFRWAVRYNDGATLSTV